MGCHIIILTDKYYVEANTEILFTKPSGIPINRAIAEVKSSQQLFTHSSPPEMPINTGDLGGKVKSEEIFAEC